LPNSSVINGAAGSVGKIVKTLLNNFHAHIGYDDDGFLVHTDKGSGKQKVSLQRWPSVEAAKTAVATELAKIGWETLAEPPPAA